MEEQDFSGTLEILTRESDGQVYACTYEVSAEAGEVSVETAVADGVSAGRRQRYATEAGEDWASEEEASSYLSRSLRVDSRGLQFRGG